MYTYCLERWIVNSVLYITVLCLLQAYPEKYGEPMTFSGVFYYLAPVNVACTFGSAERNIYMGVITLKNDNCRLL